MARVVVSESIKTKIKGNNMSLIIEATATGFRMSRVNTKDQDRIADQEILPPVIQLPEELNEEPLQQGGDSGILEENPAGLDTSPEGNDDEYEVSETAEPEQAENDIGYQDKRNIETVGIDNTEYSLPPNVTEAPRNENEMHIGLIKDNPKLVEIYLQVSDDKGDLFPDKESLETFHHLERV